MAVMHWNASRPSPSAAQPPQSSRGTAADPVPEVGEVGDEGTAPAEAGMNRVAASTATRAASTPRRRRRQDSRTVPTRDPLWPAPATPDGTGVRGGSCLVRPAYLWESSASTGRRRRAQTGP